MNSEELRIVQLVNEGRHEEALGLSLGYTRLEMDENHLELMHKFASAQEVRSALDKAHSDLANESDADKGRRFYNIGKYNEALPLLVNEAKRRRTADNYLWCGAI